MKWMSSGLLISVLFVLCTFMGCTQTQELSTPNITEVPTVAEPISNVTTVPTATPMPVRAVTILKTPTPEPTETFSAIEPEWTEPIIVYPTAEPDTTKINFTKFKNGDFMAEYPSTWAIVNQTFELPDTTLYNKDIYKKEGRMVTFTSEDGHVKMLVTVNDFITPGRMSFTPTINSARTSVQMLFPNASADAAVYNWQNKKNEQGIITSKYDVLFRPDVEYYPYSYTEETWITTNHMFNVDFIVMTGNLYDYNELKYRMMKSIVTEGLQLREWW